MSYGGTFGFATLTVATDHTPVKILVTVCLVDFRKGTNGLTSACKQTPQQGPFTGAVFVFRNRRQTAIKVLMSDGQEYWLCQKRLSQKWIHWESTSSTATVGGSVQQLAAPQ